MDFDIFDILFTKVDIAVILSIMGISQACKAFIPDRFIPVVVTFLGVGSAFIITPPTSSWRVWATAAIYYAGAADLFYTVIWQTIMNKINLMDLMANLLLKWKEKKEGL